MMFWLTNPVINARLNRSIVFPRLLSVSADALVHAEGSADAETVPNE